MATPNIADQSGQNTTPEKTYTISELLESFPTLSYRIHVFVFDLRSFREKSDVQESSQARLNESLDLLYLSAPYFTPEEVHAMKHTLVGARALETFVQESLDERLERRAKKRQDSKDFRICCAHDLAPGLRGSFQHRPEAAREG
ncbi:MAG: hypothetical protein M4579_002172 [Chaenotheca gracillima]|nr:MAG: hypothetical protein M4579_002172 [Chaenotheca gracillima]